MSAYRKPGEPGQDRPKPPRPTRPWTTSSGDLVSVALALSIGASALGGGALWHVVNAQWDWAAGMALPALVVGAAAAFLFATLRQIARWRDWEDRDE
jgi:cytochrome c biogenesis protein CcdA